MSLRTPVGRSGVHVLLKRFIQGMRSPMPPFVSLSSKDFADVDRLDLAGTARGDRVAVACVLTDRAIHELAPLVLSAMGREADAARLWLMPAIDSPAAAREALHHCGEILLRCTQSGDKRIVGVTSALAALGFVASNDLREAAYEAGRCAGLAFRFATNRWDANRVVFKMLRDAGRAAFQAPVAVAPTEATRPAKRSPSKRPRVAAKPRRKAASPGRPARRAAQKAKRAVAPRRRR